MNDKKSAEKNQKFSATALENLPLTMAYVPFQRLGKVYENENALKNGTLFPDIDKPLVSWGCKK